MLERFQRRQSTFELLRIVAMLLIVTLHLIIYDQRSSLMSDKISLQLLHYLSGTGVSLFAILSGYLGVVPSFKKIYSLWFDTRFYFLIGSIISLIFGYQIDKVIIYRCIGPGNLGYWYINAYIELCIVLLSCGSIRDNAYLNKRLMILLVCYHYIGKWFSFNIGTEFSLLFACYIFGREIAYGRLSLNNMSLGGIVILGG